MKKIEKLIDAIEKLYQEADKSSENAAMGYDEGYYNGETTAYAEVLELLKTSK